MEISSINLRFLQYLIHSTRECCRSQKVKKKQFLVCSKGINFNIPLVFTLVHIHKKLRQITHFCGGFSNTGREKKHSDKITRQLGGFWKVPRLKGESEKWFKWKILPPICTKKNHRNFLLNRKSSFFLFHLFLFY